MLFTFNLCLMSSYKTVKYTYWVHIWYAYGASTPFFLIIPLLVKFVAFSYNNIQIYIMIHFLRLSFFVVITKDNFLLLNLILWCFIVNWKILWKYISHTRYRTRTYASLFQTVLLCPEQYYINFVMLSYWCTCILIYFNSAYRIPGTLPIPMPSLFQTDLKLYFSYNRWNILLSKYKWLFDARVN